MRVVTERKFVDRLFFKISHLIIDNKYTKYYTTCLRNIKQIKFFVFVNLYVVKVLNIILLRILWKSKLHKIQTVEYNFLFVYLISRLRILFCITSPICVSTVFCFTITYVVSTCTENCVNNQVAASFISHRISTFLFISVERKMPYLTTE
jgi:hypothetical protein